MLNTADDASVTPSTRTEPSRWKGLARLRGTVPFAVLCACALLTLEGLLWGLLNPPLRTPDETQHVNSIVRLADGGGWPPPGDAQVEQRLFAAQQLSGVMSGGRTILPNAPERFKPGLNPNARIFTQVPPTGVLDRASSDELRGAVTSYGMVDQMTQHPPGYYAVMAGIYTVGSLDHWRFDRAIYLLRACTALTMFFVPLCCYLTARRLRLSEAASVFAAFVPALIPQVGFLAGSVTNDGMTILLASVGILLLTNVAVDGPTWRRLLALGVTVGLCCLMKGTALSLVPMIPVAVWLGARAQGHRGTAALRRALPGALLTLTVAFVIGGWWWALNLLRYGTLQPEATSLPTWPLPTLSFWDFVWAFIDRVGNSFFGNFALLELPMARPLTWTLSALFAVLVVVALTRRAQWEVLLLLAALPALTVVMLFNTTYQLHLQSHVLPGLQGRYLFTVLVSIAVFVAVGLERVGKAVHAPRLVFLAAAVGGLLLSLFGAWHAFRGYYWEPGWPWVAAVSRWLSWAPYSWKVIALFAVLGAAAATGALFGLLRRSVAEPVGCAPAPARAGWG